jgi:putative FmdB family regulatory protein
MPIYEYECSKCGKTIEVLQKMSDKPLKKHEKCGGALTKLISASGFQFKGTGWYVTDYGRKGAPESAENAKDNKAESKESKETKDSKESKESKESKDTSSNGNKESSSGSKAGTEKTGKKDSSSKSGAKKD